MESQTTQATTTQATLLVALGDGGGVYAPKVAAAVSRLSGQTVKLGAVQKWKENDHIPHKWRPFVRALAQERGLDLPPALKDPAVRAAESA